ncbi:MAG TPA: NBR1-Ig-like domain-containing protein, partial [Anaerolineales bacterium]|nr:NBR1-Ig-like domain-containing protein [Anaerolineales bacterium]
PFPTFALPGLTPLGTLVPGSTALPTPVGGGALSFPVGCNDAKFIGETVPDKTKIDAQKDFKKAWSMLNVGTCTWDEGYTFSFKSGERLSGADVKITREADFTEPGSSQAFVVTLKAPNKVGEFIGFWQMRSDDGTWFGSLVSVDIVVD